MFKKITILMLLPQLTFATVETDFLSRNQGSEPTYQGRKYCAQCAFLSKQNEADCPRNVDYLVNQTLTNTIYGALIGKKMLDVCAPTLTTIKTSSEKLDYNLSTTLKHEFNVSQNSIEACFEKNEINFSRLKIGKESTKKVFTAYLHTINRNILDQQSENLKQIGAIDQLLGKRPLSNFECDQNFEKTCKQIRSCEGSNSMDDVTEFSINGLKEISALELQMSNVLELRSNGKISSSQQKEMITDINKKISFIKSLMPWLQGDVLKKSYSSIMAKVRSKENFGAKIEFKNQFTKQITQAQVLLKKQFYETSASQNCLKNNLGCTSKILEKMNSYAVKNYSNNKIDFSKFDGKNEKSRNAFIEIQDTDLLLTSGSCVGKLMEGKKDIDEAVMLVASTGVGLAVGGLGGVLKLGQMAAKFYQVGSRMKGVGSALLLAAESKNMMSSFSSVANECQKAVNHLETAQERGETGCSKDGGSNYKLTNLNSCIVNISLTTLPYILSIRNLKGNTVSTAEKEATAQLGETQKALLLKKMTNPLISLKDKEDLAEAMAKLNLTKEESASVIAKLNKAIKNDKDKNRLKDYMTFVLSLKKEDQKLALKELQDVVLTSGNFNTGGYAQKFYLKENKFYLFEKIKMESSKRQLIKQGKSVQAAEEESVQIARASRRALQKKYYACQSKTSTPEIKLAAKRYSGLAVALGVGGATYGYVTNNKEKLKENKSEFFGKLGYDVAMAYVLSKISAGIMKDPGGSTLRRYGVANAGSAAVGVIDAAVYSKLYGVSEDEARKKVEEITHSKEAMQELKVLDQYINKNNLIDSFKNKIVETYKLAISSPDKDSFLGKAPYDLEIEKFSTLSKDDLEKPEVKEKLVKAVLAQMNSGSISAIFASGDKGADRWVNDRAWNATFGIPKGMAVGVAIFQTLCIGADRPVLSLGVASGIQFANQFLSGDAYYKFRKEFIGQ